MKKLTKVAFLICIVFCVLLSSTLLDVDASNRYTINGVSVANDDFSSAKNDCWNYANNLYKKIWGDKYSVSNSFSSSNNMLRNLPDSMLLLNATNLKKYVSQAQLGSCLRICNSSYLHGSDGWGHSQIIVQKDNNGFTVFEGGLTDSPHRREKYYTWSSYCSNWDYDYIKYIQWPGANVYQEDSIEVTSSKTYVYLTLGEKESETINIGYTGYYSGNWNLRWERSDSSVSCTWGSWENSLCPLTITANEAGDVSVTVSIIDKDTEEVLDYIYVYVTVYDPSYTVFYQPEGGSFSHTYTSVTVGESIYLPDEVPTRFGANFLGWALSPSGDPIYQPGDLFTPDGDTNLWAVWGLPSRIYELMISQVTIPYSGVGVYYEFTPETTGYYRFSGMDMEGNGGGDSVVEVFSAYDNSIGYDDDSGDGTMFDLSGCILEAGCTYYVYVRLWSGTGTFYYGVSQYGMIAYVDNGELVAVEGIIPGESTTLPKWQTLGYNLIGWATSSDGAVAYQPGEVITFTGSTTLRAVWQEAEQINPQSTPQVTIQNSDVGVYYKFVPTETAYYRFAALDVDGNGGQDSVAYLYTQAGVQLGFDDDSGVGVMFDLKDVYLEAYTTYYLYVKLYRGTGSFYFGVGQGYEVSYDANGGTGAPDPFIHYVGFGDSVLSTQIPTREGFEFNGWSYSPFSVDPGYAAGENFSTNRSLTLYAAWRKMCGNLKENSSTVTTVSNGLIPHYYTVVPAVSGRYVVYSTGSYGDNFFEKPMVMLYDESFYPVYNSYENAGWHIGGGEDGNFRWEMDLVAGKTYYLAIAFQPGITGTIPFTFGHVYTVTYDANGGTGEPEAQSKDYNTAITLSDAVPTRAGYTFMGWAPSKSAASASYLSGSSFSTNANTTLYAVWKANTYTVSYNANGGSGTPGSQTKTHGQALSLSSTVPTREGYTFLGWSASSSATTASYAAGSSFTTNADTTLYAVWKLNTYKISYHANGGSGTPDSQSKTHGQTLTLSSTVPTREGYTFLGWSASSSATTASYAAGGSFSTNANTTLYAVWKANTYTVSYNANGGSGAPESQIKTHGQALSLSSTAPTREGYTFLGWSASSNATTASYAAGSSFTTNADTTLYAVWEKVHLGTVEYWSIVLRGDLEVNFYVRVNDELADTATIMVTMADEYYSYKPSKLQKDSSGRYIVKVRVAAAQMNECIVIMGMNRGQVGTISSYTVRQYCDKVLSNSSYSSYHPIVKGMLRYGAAAQSYFGYDAENPADADISGEMAYEVPETVDPMTAEGRIEGVAFYGASLLHRDRIAVRYYFTGDVSDCSFSVGDKTYLPVSKDSMHYIEIPDILPHELDQNIVLTVTDAQGDTIHVSYSPMHYIVRMYQTGDAALKTLLKALYNYHILAKEANITMDLC